MDYDPDSGDERDVRYSQYEPREPCSCIPALTSGNVSSMIYEQVHVLFRDVVLSEGRQLVLGNDAAIIALLGF